MVVIKAEENEIKDLVYWVALSEAPIDRQFIINYAQEYKSLEGFWTAPKDYFIDLGLEDSVVRSFLEHRSKADLSRYEKLIRNLQHQQIEIIRFVDENYPNKLRLIGRHASLTPPPLLFRRGALTEFEHCISVVGTRQSSHYGNLMSREVGRELAKNGYTVVSGLARGIDTQAHCGALDVGGKTISVLAWLEPVYPPENRSLLGDILISGAAISERYHAPKGRAEHLFVERNRITSGISDAVIVIESRISGGTIWQFDFAQKQGKPIFVLTPRDGGTPIKEGYDYFVERGAVQFRSPEDLVDKLNEVSKRQKDLIEY